MQKGAFCGLQNTSKCVFDRGSAQNPAGRAYDARPLSRLGRGYPSYTPPHSAFRFRGQIVFTHAYIRVDQTTPHPCHKVSHWTDTLPILKRDVINEWPLTLNNLEHQFVVRVTRIVTKRLKLGSCIVH